MRVLRMIIDHKYNLELPDEDICEYNEFAILKTLQTGLDYLYRQVRNLEEEAARRLDAENLVVFCMGNDPRLQGLPLRLVSCSYIWYSVTACNYVRIVGWLLSGGDPQKARAYQYRVISNVTLWRNKFGAHFAFADPRNEDSPADKFATQIPWQVAFFDDSFVAGSGQVSLGSEEGGSASRQDWEWNLTKTHRELGERYGWATE